MEPALDRAVDEAAPSVGVVGAGESEEAVTEVEPCQRAGGGSRVGASAMSLANSSATQSGLHRADRAPGMSRPMTSSMACASVGSIAPASGSESDHDDAVAVGVLALEEVERPVLLAERDERLGHALQTEPHLGAEAGLSRIHWWRPSRRERGDSIRDEAAASGKVTIACRAVDLAVGGGHPHGLVVVVDRLDDGPEAELGVRVIRDRLREAPGAAVDLVRRARLEVDPAQSPFVSATQRSAWV